MFRFLVFLLFVTTLSYSQEENGSWVNIVETKPRFLEDQDLSEQENLKSFRNKVNLHFNKNIDRSKLKDSIKNKLYVNFKVDTLGISTFHKIYPRKAETQYL